MRDRIRKLRTHLTLSRTEFEQQTGVPAKTWENVENGLQKVNEDHLNAVTNRWPQYAYWLLTGKTLPDAGQISPELEEIREKLERAG